MPNSPFLRVQDFLNTRAREAILPHIVWSIEPESEARLLDVGGGTGAAAERFAKGSTEVVVLEPDRKKREYGRTRRIHLRFVEGSAENIPFPDEHFDRAVALVSFHHVKDQDKALDEIRRVLKPSGRVVFHEFDPESPRGKLNRFFENDVMGHECTFLLPSELKERLERHGFQDVSVESVMVGYVLNATK